MGRDDPLKSSFIPGIDMSVQDKDDLLAFLRSFTDEGFLENPAYSDPWTKGD